MPRTGAVKIGRHSTVEPASFGLTPGARPVRRIRPRTYRLSMPGDFPTLKGTLPALRVETLLEMDGFGHLEVNPNIVLMAAQPHHLIYFEPTGPHTSTRRIYTPDAAALTKDGMLVVVDFKLTRGANSASWIRRKALIERAYREDHGALHAVIAEPVIRLQPRFRNIGILLMHRRIVEDAAADVALAAAVLSLGLPTTIGALESAVDLPHHLPHVNRARTAILAMALRGEMVLDLGVPLGRATTVSAPASREAP